MSTQQQTSNRAAYLSWLLISIFFGYQYILRIAPNVMTDALRATFLLKAEEFATLGALYLLTYSLLQIPLGILIDRKGVKPILIISLILCMVGTLMFAYAEYYAVVQVARILIGAGSACAFMCALKTIADHFPPGKRGFLSGMTLMLGTASALLSGKMVLALMEYFTWREVSAGTAVLGGLLLCIIYIAIRPTDKDQALRLNVLSWKEVGLTVLGICQHRKIMLYALLAVGAYTPLAAITDLWGASFLSKKFALSYQDAAACSLLMYLGLAIGSLILPWLCEKYDQLEWGIIACTFGILILFVVLFYGSFTSILMLKSVLIGIGFLCGAEMMCFTGALLYAQKHNSGEVIGVVNTLNILGGAVLQQSIGTILDWQWDGTYDHEGIRVYSPDQFINAMTIIAVLLLLCSIASLFLLHERRIHHRIKYED